MGYQQQKSSYKVRLLITTIRPSLASLHRPPCSSRSSWPRCSPCTGLACHTLQHYAQHRRWLLLRSRSPTIDTWDLDSHGEQLTLLQLRELGEQLQKLHPGVRDMGQSSPAQVRMHCNVTIHTTLHRRATACGRSTGSTSVSRARRCMTPQPSACWSLAPGGLWGCILPSRCAGVGMVCTWSYWQLYVVI